MLKRFHIPLISLCGRVHSALGKSAVVCLDVSVEKEACPWNLAPTASTTAALVMGDALAIALLETRGFTKEDFALAHPGGVLGRRLLLHVQDVMHKAEEIPKVMPTVTVAEALVEMSAKRLGFTAIADHTGKLLGIFTDGDLRRALDKKINIHTTPIATVIAQGGVHVSALMLAEEALRIMEEKKITQGFYCLQNRRYLSEHWQSRFFCTSRRSQSR